MKKDEQGSDMIYPWKPSVPVGHDSFMGPSGVIAYLELDNRKCTVTEGAVCFPTANEVRYTSVAGETKDVCYMRVTVTEPAMIQRSNH